MTPRRGSTPRLTDRQSQCDFDFISVEYENEHVRGIGQGEARHKKYKRLKLGGGQAYDHSND
jgi:hypothetical protein